MPVKLRYGVHGGRFEYGRDSLNSKRTDLFRIYEDISPFFVVICSMFVVLPNISIME